MNERLTAVAAGSCFSSLERVLPLQGKEFVGTPIELVSALLLTIKVAPQVLTDLSLVFLRTGRLYFFAYIFIFYNLNN